MRGNSARSATPHGFELWLVSNVFAVALWLLAIGATVSAFIATGIVSIAAAIFALACLWFGWRVSLQSGTRRRIALMLDRRFVRDGPSAEMLRRFLGEPCLQAQALWLMLRWKRVDLWVVAMRRYWREDVLFYAHPTPEIEDALNFPDEQATPR